MWDVVVNQGLKDSTLGAPVHRGFGAHFHALIQAAVGENRVGVGEAIVCSSGSTARVPSDNVLCWRVGQDVVIV